MLGVPTSGTLLRARETMPWFLGPIALALVMAGPLYAQRPGQRSFRNPAPPPVYLNHVVLVVDSATYRDIGASGFLRTEFAGVEDSAGREVQGGRNAVYLYGTHTYAQFLAPASTMPRRLVGMSAIGLGVDQPHGVLAVYARFYALVGGDSTRAAVRLVQRRKGTTVVPWYYATRVRPKRAAPEQPWFDSWVMEYHPEYLKDWYADARAASGITREQANARLANPRGYAADIVAITLALDDADASLFLDQLEAVGYHVSRSGGAAVAQGPGVMFRLVPATPERRGVVRLRFALRRGKTGQTLYRFGPKSRLRFEGKFADWTF
jgi:Family of unknown function (DUF5829)